MPELPEDFPDDVPERIAEWVAEDYGAEWESAIFHGGSDGFWSLEVTYEDGNSESIDLGTFADEPPDWMWDLYEWFDSEVADDADVDYE